MKKGKLHQMPERGEQITLNGVEVGPKLSDRDGHVVLNWLMKSHKAIETYYRRRLMMKIQGWQCLCACHRLRQWTAHCIGCDKGQKNGVPPKGTT